MTAETQPLIMTSGARLSRRLTCIRTSTYGPSWHFVQASGDAPSNYCCLMSSTGEFFGIS